MSRSPDMAMCSVRGIGVAESVSTSTVVRRALRCSLCSTPKRCSSSDHDEAEVLELDVAPEQAVRPDHDVDLAGGQVGEHGRPLALAAEAREHLDAHRLLGHAAAEGLVVLLGQDRGRHEHRGLLAGQHRLEDRAHRDLGLAEADVADEQPVHRPLGLHVEPHERPGRSLVGRVLEREAGLEASHLAVVGREGEALALRARGLDREQLGRQVGHRARDLLLAALPGLAADAVELGALAAAVGADEALDEVDAAGRHVEPRLLGELEQQEVLLALLAREALHAAVDADAVREVHDVVAGVELGQVVERARRDDAPRAAAAHGPPADELVVVHDDRPAAREGEARREAAGQQRQVGARRAAALGEHLAQALGLGLGVAEHEDQPAFGAPRREPLLLGTRRAAHRAHPQVALGLAEPQRIEVDARPRRELLQRPVDLARRRAQLEGDLREAVLELRRIDHEHGRALGQPRGQAQVARHGPGRRRGRRARLPAERQADRAQRLDRALAVDLEAAQLLDLLVEQLDAHRMVGGPGIDVEDVAAQRELARRGDQAHAREAGVGQACEQRLAVDRRARGELEARALGGRQLLEQHGAGHDEQAVAGRVQAGERDEALGAVGGQLGSRREQQLLDGQQHDGQLGEQEGEVEEQRVGGLGRGRDGDRAAAARGERAAGERRRAAPGAAQRAPLERLERRCDRRQLAQRRAQRACHRRLRRALRGEVVRPSRHHRAREASRRAART
jgi:hypothetical protein